jgi:plastocyanin
MPRSNPASATIVLLGTFVLIAAAAFLSDVSAEQSENSTSTPKVVTVLIREFKFEPATVTVHEGDTVEWKNNDIVPHTATADEGTQKPAFDSGIIHKDAGWRFVTTKKGTYNYICRLHPNMKGQLIVR